MGTKTLQESMLGEALMAKNVLTTGIVCVILVPVRFGWTSSGKGGDKWIGGRN